MRIAAFGDLHAHLYKEFDVRTDLSGSSRLDHQINAISYIRDRCMIEGIKLVLFAGDLFHARGSVNTKVKNAMYDEIKAFPACGITVVIIAGNHDQYDNSDVPLNSLHEFKQIDGIYVFDTVGVHSLYDSGKIIRIHCAPYSKNAQLVKDYIAGVKNESYTGIDIGEDVVNILLFHLGVDGGFVGKGSYPMSDAFDIEDLRPNYFKYVIGGHFHRAQFLGGYDNSLYLGAPLQHSFSDEGEDKGFYIFDTEEFGIEFVPIPSPKFYTIKGWEIPTDQNHEEFLGDCARNSDYVRFLVTEEQFEEWVQSIPEKLIYKVEYIKEYEEQTRIPIKVGMSFEEIVTKYAEENMPEALQIGLDILSEVTMK